MTIKKEEVVSLGIVLKTHPYKESDSLVTVYFKDYGKMTLIARGVKKLKNERAGKKRKRRGGGRREGQCEGRKVREGGMGGEEGSIN